MISRLQKLKKNISMNTHFLNNINKGLEWAENIGRRCFGLLRFVGILLGRKHLLAYCRQEAKITPPGCDLNNQGAGKNG